MSDRRATILVARREFVERMRERSFQVSTGVTLALVAAVAVLAGVLAGDDVESYDVGVEGGQGAAIAQLARAAASQYDARVKVTRVSVEAGRDRLRDETLDAVVTARGEVLTAGDAAPELEALLQASGRRVRGAALLREEGVSGAEAERALDPPALPVREIAGSGDRDQRRGVALAASFLLYGQLIVYGLWVALGWWRRSRRELSRCCSRPSSRVPCWPGRSSVSVCSG